MDAKSPDGHESECWKEMNAIYLGSHYAHAETTAIPLEDHLNDGLHWNARFLRQDGEIQFTILQLYLRLRGP